MSEVYLLLYVDDMLLANKDKLEVEKLKNPTQREI